MTHLGQQLSALIDGELEASERERVLVHVSRCGSCRDEVAAIRTLKQKINALGEAAAGAGFTGRLMSLSEMLGLDDSRWAGRFPPLPSTGSWPEHTRPSQHGASSGHDRESRQDQRSGRFFLAGSVAIFLAGLGTAAVIAGGEPQARAPAPPVRPSVDVLVAPHNSGDQVPSSRPGTVVLQARYRNEPSFPAFGATTLPGQP